MKVKCSWKVQFGLAFLSLHMIHPLPMCLTDTLPLITQNLCFIADNTYSVPKWEISWHCWISSCTTWYLTGRINWCFAELWISAFDNNAPILVISLSSSKMVLIWGACFSLIMVGSVSVLEPPLQILHALSILKVMLQLLQFLELSKSFSYLCFLHSNKIVSSNIWLWWFFDSWKTFHNPHKAACWKLLLSIYPSSWFLDCLHQFCQLLCCLIDVLLLKNLGQVTYDFPCLSRCKRLAGSISPLVHITCCQSPVSV